MKCFFGLIQPILYKKSKDITKFSFWTRIKRDILSFVSLCSLLHVRIDSFRVFGDDLMYRSLNTQLNTNSFFSLFFAFYFTDRLKSGDFS